MPSTIMNRMKTSRQPAMNGWLRLVLFSSGVLMIASCERLVSDDIPTDPVTLESLNQEGMAAFKDGDAELAIEKFNQALERNVDPDSAIAAYQGLGWAYSRVNKPSLAINMFSFILSIESINSGKNPVVEDKVVAISAPVTVTPAPADTFGLGRWVITLANADDYLIKVAQISSYSAEHIQKFKVGETNNEIEGGTAALGLDKSPLSDSAGVGVASATSTSLSFNSDTLITAVESIDQLNTYSDFFLDMETWEIRIKPRFWTVKGLAANYLYFEDTYQVNNFDLKTISLGETLDDGDGSSFPVIVPVVYPGGKTFYVSGLFFNKAEGGTHNMADAYAGLAAANFRKGDYEAAIEAGKTAILINEYRSDEVPSYVYQRQLFEGDDAVGLWEIYHLLAAAHLKKKDFRNAFDYLEKLGATAPDPETSPRYAFDALLILGSITKDPLWEAPQIW